MMNDYALLDSGNGEKLEKFGPYTIIRPSSYAVWRPRDIWKDFDAKFSREAKKGWTFKKKLPPSWNIEIGGIRFKISPTEFGHLGVFPEHSLFFNRLKDLLKRKNILNLFAYTGGITLFLAKYGASVCHLDASKQSISWARENAKLNKLESAPIRWIADDAQKFLKRELKRGVKYDGIILDPPTFGRGPKGEVFKIERDIYPILRMCEALLSKGSFLLFTCHSPGFSKSTLEKLLKQTMPKGNIESEELFLGRGDFSIPSGSYAIWRGYD